MEIEMLDAPEVREEPTTALAVQDRAALALGSTKTRADLALLAVKFGNIIEIKNKAGRDECHAALMVLQDARIAVQKASKAAREDATRFSKAVIAEENSLVEITAKEELRLFNLRKVWDDAVAAEKAEKARLAAAQKLVIDNAMTWIRNHAVQAVGKSAADIKELVTSLETMEVTLETFADRAGEAEQCRLMTLDVLNGLHAAVTAQEAAAAQVEAERVRLEQERKEQAAAAQAAAEAAAKAAAEAAETAKAIADAHQARLDEQRRAFMQEQADARARQSALMEQEEAQRKTLADERAAFEAEKAAKAAADQKAIDDAALAAAPVILEPAAGAAEIIAQAEAGDVEYITAAAIDPSDADIIFCAARAVSLEYGLTFGEAIHRLAAVESWTQTEGATA